LKTRILAICKIKLAGQSIIAPYLLPAKRNAIDGGIRQNGKNFNIN
jgi:hypothetical protein